MTLKLCIRDKQKGEHVSLVEDKPSVVKHHTTKTKEMVEVWVPSVWVPGPLHQAPSQHACSGFHKQATLLHLQENLVA